MGRGGIPSNSPSSCKMRREPGSSTVSSMRLLLSSFALVALVLATQAQITFPPIKDARATKMTEANVPPGHEHQLCITLSDGSRRKAGTDTYQYFSHEITAEVFAKAISSRNWGIACSPSADSMSCPNLANARFLHSTLDLEPKDAYHRQACWIFANGNDRAITARLVVHFTLSKVKNGFVLLLRKPGDRAPIFTSVQSACACSSDDKNVTAYFAAELQPSHRFFAKRGDVIEINAISKTKELGLPDGCHELTPAKYHVKIERIYPFEQPADYKSVLVGQVVSDQVSDVSYAFDQH